MRGPLPGGISVADLGVNIWQPAFNRFNPSVCPATFSIGQNPHATFNRSNFTLADDLHWVKGTHNFAVGFHGEIARVDVVNDFNAPGKFAFDATNTNSAMASFFLGHLSRSLKPTVSSRITVLNFSASMFRTVGSLTAG